MQPSSCADISLNIFYFRPDPVAVWAGAECSGCSVCCVWSVWSHTSWSWSVSSSSWSTGSASSPRHLPCSLLSPQTWDIPSERSCWSRSLQWSQSQGELRHLLSAPQSLTIPAPGHQQLQPGGETQAGILRLNQIIIIFILETSIKTWSGSRSHQERIFPQTRWWTPGSSYSGFFILSSSHQLKPLR